MTRQEVFDKVARHLQQQGQPAMRQGRPVLQTRRGPLQKSAIGCLLDRYTPAAELTEQYRENLLRQSGVDMEQNRDLVESLERIHDCEVPENWLAALRSVADELNLSHAVLEEVAAVVA